MKGTLEFEIKAVIDTSNIKLNEFILQLPMAVVNTFTFITDVYYDNKNYDLYKKGIFIRIRNDKYLEIKQDNDELLTHTNTKEFKFDLPLSRHDTIKISSFLQSYVKQYFSDSKSLFQDFNLNEITKIIKTRTAYKLNNLIIAIDDVEGLGKFIEIEGNSRTEFEEIKQIASSLDLTNMEVGYVELMLRKQNFDVYKKGRYILQIDKN
jgi:predicted adenylyl cyclase CyaB